MKRTQRILAKEVMEQRNKVLENCKYSSEFSEPLIELLEPTIMSDINDHITRVIASMNDQNKHVDIISTLHSDKDINEVVPLLEFRLDSTKNLILKDLCTIVGDDARMATNIIFTHSELVDKSVIMINSINSDKNLSRSERIIGIVNVETIYILKLFLYLIETIKDDILTFYIKKVTEAITVTEEKVGEAS